jgi:hypothetical protein
VISSRALRVEQICGWKKYKSLKIQVNCNTASHPRKDTKALITEKNNDIFSRLVRYQIPLPRRAFFPTVDSKKTTEEHEDEESFLIFCDYLTTTETAEVCLWVKESRSYSFQDSASRSMAMLGFKVKVEDINETEQGHLSILFIFTKAAIRETKPIFEPKDKKKASEPKLVAPDKRPTSARSAFPVWIKVVGLVLAILFAVCLQTLV